MIDLTNINHSFNLIKAPINIRRILGSDKDFRAWLRTGTLDDLKGTLKAFEDDQMYYDCEIINEIIKEKQTIKRLYLP